MKIKPAKVIEIIYPINTSEVISQYDYSVGKCSYLSILTKKNSEYGFERKNLPIRLNEDKKSAIIREFIRLGEIIEVSENFPQNKSFKYYYVVFPGGNNYFYIDNQKTESNLIEIRFSDIIIDLKRYTKLAYEERLHLIRELIEFSVIESLIISLPDIYCRKIREYDPYYVLDLNNYDFFNKCLTIKSRKQITEMKKIIEDKINLVKSRSLEMNDKMILDLHSSGFID